ncbi:MAG: phosphoglucosamine mutase, partial [Armatimonadetes bacterium]|nr:phosphoglucosamine mutase [Armatimonadota bacterium]
MGKLFGTDGIRGIANQELTPELAFQLGRAAAFYFKQNYPKAQFIAGKDTRLSGDMLEGALISGICSAGVSVLKAGILPAPGIAYLTRTLKSQAGVVISASHNPIEDNGIKFFSSNGFKLSDEVEEKIEKRMNNLEKLPRPIAKEIGRVKEFPFAAESYLNYIKSKIKVNLEGLKIVLDCAHGAAYFCAPKLFQDMGAQILVLNNQPNGVNINVECGSTNPRLLQKIVVASGADLGVAFDGDADRAIFVDEKGGIVDGDQVINIFAALLKEKGQLKGNKVVATVMSNLGLEQSLKKIGVELIRTNVGDRYVLEAMRKEGAILGGEQSGHIILLSHNTTGDGLITALFLTKILKEKKITLSNLARRMILLPQILINIKN